MEVWHDIQVLKRQGLKKKAIARKLKISKNTVKRYWHRLVPPKYQRQAVAKRLDPFSPQIQEMLQQRFIGTRIYEELTKLGYTGSLTSLYRYLRQFQVEDCSKATIRFETEPGQQMQYDWTQWLLPVAGQTRKIYFHQVILSFSRYKYITFTLDVTHTSILRVLDRALVFFQGVPDQLVIDNPKQLVLSHDHQGVRRYQDDFLAFLGGYGLEPDPCRPYRARTKGKVENPFFYLKEHFLRGLEVADLEELEQRLAQFLEQYNARPHGTTGRAPVDLFPQENLRPLVPVPLVLRRETRKVSWDGYVHVDSNRYPVPLAWAGKKVWIDKVMGRWLEVLGPDLKLISRQELCWGHRVTLPHPEHTQQSRAYLDRKEQRRARVKTLFRETFPALAPDFLALAEQSLGLNAAYHLDKILDLLAVYDHQTVGSALQEALGAGMASVQAIKAFLPESPPPLLPTPLGQLRSLPTVAKRPLSCYGAACGGGQ